MISRKPAQSLSTRRWEPGPTACLLALSRLPALAASPVYNFATYEVIPLAEMEEVPVVAT